MFSPPSASSAISSAVGGLGDSSVLGIQFLFFTSRFPKRNEVVQLTLIILADFKYERVQARSDPADRPVLFRHIRTLVEVIGAAEYCLGLFKADPPGADSPAIAGSCADRSPSAS